MIPHLYYRRDTRRDPHWFCLTCGDRLSQRRDSSPTPADATGTR